MCVRDDGNGRDRKRLREPSNVHCCRKRFGCATAITAGTAAAGASGTRNHRSGSRTVSDTAERHPKNASLKRERKRNAESIAGRPSVAAAAAAVAVWHDADSAVGGSLALSTAAAAPVPVELQLLPASRKN